MSLFSYVQQGVGQMQIGRPASAGLLHRHPGGPLPRFGQLEVRPGESAVFFRHGACLGVLGPGRHSLSGQTLPFLQPAEGPAGIDAELWMVGGPTELKIGGSLGSFEDALGAHSQVRLAASATVAAEDPVRLAMEAMDAGSAPLEPLLQRRLLSGIKDAFARRLLQGRIDPSQPASVEAALLEAAAEQRSFGLAELGLRLEALKVVHLATASGTPLKSRAPSVAPAPAPVPAAPAPAPAARPGVRSARFGASNVLFWDTLHEMQVRVNAFGCFEGDPVPPSHEEWLKGGIVQTLHQAARTWSGSVLDLPARKEEWGAYVSQAVLPQVRHHANLRGRVVLEGVSLHKQDEQELRRRAALRRGR